MTKRNDEVKDEDVEKDKETRYTGDEAKEALLQEVMKKASKPD